MNDLVVLETLPPPTIIYASGGAEDLLNRIKSDVRNRVRDISTKKGREEIASVAFKIAKTKTALDTMGKTLIEEAQATVNAVNTERKRIRDELDALKEEFRSPLTEWEEKEQDRIDTLENAINAIEAQLNYPDNFTANEIESRLKTVEAGDEFFDWMEFAERAKRMREYVVSTLAAELESKRKYETDQAELKRLREEEEKAKKEALAAEQKAAQERAAAIMERQRIENEKQEAVEKAAKAERDRVAAEEKAKADAKAAAKQAEREKQEAIQKERDRGEAEKKAAQEAIAKREADKAHRKKINNEILSALKQAHESLYVEQLKAIIMTIANGEIPHVKISY